MINDVDDATRLNDALAAAQAQNERLREALAMAALSAEGFANEADRMARRIKELLRDLRNECDD